MLPYPRTRVKEEVVLVVRAETPGDRQAVREVNDIAFGRVGEANVVDALRGAAEPLISLVADEDGSVVGHVLFSPVLLEPKPFGSLALGLAPLAVHPSRQRRGIGSLLITEGLKECRRLGCGAVFILGDPAYYRRFGFAPAVRGGFRSEYEVPEEAFMVAELEPGALEGRHGRVRYRPEFSAL